MYNKQQIVLTIWPSHIHAYSLIFTKIFVTNIVVGEARIIELYFMYFIPTVVHTVLQNSVLLSIEETTRPNEAGA